MVHFLIRKWYTFKLVYTPEDQNRDDMAKTTNEQLKEKDAEIKRLRKALELEKLRSKAFSTMIDLAEETFNIPVRKKSGTKQ